MTKDGLAIVELLEDRESQLDDHLGYESPDVHHTNSQQLSDCTTIEEMLSIAWDSEDEQYRAGFRAGYLDLLHDLRNLLECGFLEEQRKDV